MRKSFKYRYICIVYMSIKKIDCEYCSFSTTKPSVMKKHMTTKKHNDNVREFEDDMEIMKKSYSVVLMSKELMQIKIMNANAKYKKMDKIITELYFSHFIDALIDNYSKNSLDEYISSVIASEFTGNIDSPYICIDIEKEDCRFNVVVDNKRENIDDSGGEILSQLIIKATLIHMTNIIHTIFKTDIETCCNLYHYVDRKYKADGKTILDECMLCTAMLMEKLERNKITIEQSKLVQNNIINTMEKEIAVYDDEVNNVKDKLTKITEELIKPEMVINVKKKLLPKIYLKI